MAKVARDKVLPLAQEAAAFWKQDLGEDFTVMGLTLAQFEAKLPVLQALLADIAEIEATLNVKTGEAATRVDELCQDVVNLRQAVKIAKGKDSREYEDAPKIPRWGKKKESTATPSGQ